MSIPYLSVEIAVFVVGVVTVQLYVDALTQPGQAHDDEQFQEEDQLETKSSFITTLPKS